MVFGRSDIIKPAFKKINLAAVCRIRKLCSVQSRERRVPEAQKLPSGPGQRLKVDCENCPGLRTVCLVHSVVSLLIVGCGG